MSRVLVRVLVVSTFGIVAAACGDDGGTQNGEAPDTVLSVTPAAVSTARLANFEFSATGTVTDFKCALDGSGASRCVSPLSIEVGDGDHTITITAFNGTVGDETPATFAWRVDATAPNTEITGGPPAFDNSMNVEITFTGTPEADVARFECSLDDADFVTCTSPAPFTGLMSGVHTVRVRAVDAAGNPDPSPAQRSWTLDTSTPDTAITGGPEQDSTTGGNVEFTFTSPDPAATFECKFDSGTFVSCSSPAAYNALATGPHTFEVRAKNPISNTLDPTPASRTWMVDGSAPEVSIDSQPTNPSNDATPAFTFSSASPDIEGFECQVDGVAPFAACTSPFESPTLVDGTYTFRVRVTDNVGNIGLDTYTWSVDTSAPTVAIIGGPMGPSASSTAMFTFQTSGSPTTIRCRLDAGVLSACVSPITYNNLPDGPHTFTVTVADGAGNSSSAMRMFEVITQGPSVEITEGPAEGSSINDSTPTFSFTSTNANEIDCRIDGGTYQPCTSPFTTQTLSNGLHSFEVRVRDTALNSATATRSFTVDTLPPTVMITAGPNGPTNDTTPTFSFLTGGMPTLTQCRFDMGTFISCTSPFTAVTPLTAGPHRFEVRVTDIAGNTSVDTRDFTLVTSGPTVTITGGPSGPTGDNTPTFTFTTTNSPTVIECQVDALAFAPCVSPFTTSSLADGIHSVTVRVGDVAGNTATDSRTFTVDTERPTVTITGGPEGPTNDTTPTFTFVSNAPTVECRIGMGAFSTCASSFTPAALGEGSYTFEVRGSDDAGNTTSATRNFSIDTTAPSLSINARLGTSDNVTNPNPNESINDPTPLFTFTATSFQTLECAMNGGFVPCTSGMFQVADDLGGTPAGAGSGFLPDDHRFTVRATDAAGNVATVVRIFDVNSLAPPNASLVSGPTTTCPADDVTPCNPVTAVSAITNHGGQTVMAVRRVPAFTFVLPVGNWTQVACRFNTQAFANCTPTGPNVNTTFTYSNPALLPEGNNSLTIRVCNASFECTTNVFPFTVDTVAPTVAYSTGPSGSCADGPPDNVTCDPTNRVLPTFTYSVGGGATLYRCRLSASATPTGAFENCDTQTGAAGTQVFDGIPLVDNVRYSFGVRVYDPAFNLAQASRDNFLVDLIAPDITVTPPNAPPAAFRGVNVPAFTFSTTNERNPQTFECEFTNNAGVVGAWTPCTSPFRPTTAEGTYRVRIRMTDLAGNRTTVPDVASPAFQYRIDDTPPVVAITPVAASFTDGATGKLTRNNKPRFVVRITNPAPGGVTPSDIVLASTLCSFVNDDGATPTGCTIVTPGDSFYDADGAIVEPSTNLIDPSPNSILNWEIRVSAVDQATNSASSLWDFTADLTAPVLTVGAYTPASPTRTTPTLAFTLTDERAGIVRQCGHDTDATVPVTACASPTSFTTAALATNGSADGTNFYRINGIDAAGNTVDNVSSFNFDTTAPTPAINAAAPGPGETEPANDNMPSIAYTITNTVPVNALPGAVASNIVAVSCTLARSALPGSGTGMVPGCVVTPSLPAAGPITGSITGDAAFTDGFYELTLTARDAANTGGNTGNLSATYTFRIDTTPPVFGAISGPANGAELNSTSNTPTWTSSVTDARPFTATCTLTGTLAAGGSYTNTQTCAADSTGGSPYSATLTYTPPAALAPGSYSLAITATDGLNPAASPAGFPRSFTVESAPPAITAASSVAAGAELNSSNNSVQVTVTASSDASAYSVQCRITGTLAGGGTYGPFTQACGADSTAPSPFSDAATYTFNQGPLAPGAYSVDVVGTDTLGNTASATTFPRAFTVEDDAPTVTTTLAYTGASVINGTTAPAFSVNVSDVSSGTVDCTLTPPGTSLTDVVTFGTSPMSQAFTITNPGTSGTYSLACTATDNLGTSVSVGSASFTVDATAPTITGFAPVGFVSGATIVDNTPGFSITTTDASAGQIDCAATPMGTFTNVTTFTAGTGIVTNFSLPMLADGTYTLTCTATDTLGNGPSTATAPITFTVDTTSSITVTVTNPTGGGTIGPAGSPVTYTVSVRAASAFSVGCQYTGANMFTGGTAGASFGTITSYNFLTNFTPTTFTSSGPQTLTCNLTAATGNASDSATFNVDVSPPTFGTVACTDAAAASCSFMLAGDDANGATCRFDSNPAVPCTSPHVYSGMPLAPGSHTFTVSSTDDFGNTGTASDSFTVPSMVAIAIDGPADGADVNVPPSYSFTVNGPADHGVRCELDGMRIDCPFTYPNGVIALAEPSQGAHTVRVSIIDAPKGPRKKSRQALLPKVQLGETASRSFTFDSVAPEITVTAAPRALMNDDVARVAFSTKGAATTTCQVDGAATKACRDELVIEKLAAGTHTIDIVAFDKAGNVAKATTSFVTDPVAACLDGTSDFGLAAVPDLTQVSGSTVEMWFRSWTAADALDLFALDNATTEGIELAVSFEQDAFVVATAMGRARLPSALDLNAWHHLAFELGRDHVTLFVDGVASGTVRVDGLDGIALGDKPVLWLGLDQGAGHAPGAFADVRVSRGAVYDRAFRATSPAQASESTLHLFPADEGADLMSEDLMASGALSWSVPVWGTCEADPVGLRAPVGSGPGNVAAPGATEMAP